MPIKLVLNNLQHYSYDKVSLNADSHQTADSTLSVCTSKESELKGLKTTLFLPSTKNAHKEHNKQKRAKKNLICAFFIFVPFL